MFHYSNVLFLTRGLLSNFLKIVLINKINLALFAREAATRTRVATIRIHRIIFFARGDIDSGENSCFAFTAAVSPPEGHADGTNILCYVFRYIYTYLGYL